MKATSEILRVDGAFCWIEEQRIVRLKAAAPDGEPLALDAAQARKLGELLQRLANQLDRLGSESSQG